MSGRYLVELAEVLRDNGLDVVEYDGWKTRARGSGGYADGRPWCVMWHHTASSASIESDAAYCATGDEDAPVCNALIARDGTVWLIAAGASNTNGKGGPWPVSRGTVPVDQMNTHAVGLEICNNGVGEPYPLVQLDAVFAVSLALTEWLDLTPVDAVEHAEWAPDRKIDPATAAAVPNPWHPRSVNSSGTWNGDDLRDELARLAGTPPPHRPPDPGPDPVPGPPPTLEDDNVIVALDTNGTAWVGDGIRRRPLATEHDFNVHVVLGAEGAFRFVNVSGGAVRGWPDVIVGDEYVIDALGDP